MTNEESEMTGFSVFDSIIIKLENEVCIILSKSLSVSELMARRRLLHV